MAGLEGKTALVTGAGRGIGRAIALRLARDGAFVIVHYGGSRAAAATVLGEVERGGGQGFTVGADLARADAAAALFAAIDAELAERGMAGLDILVNNAGVALPGDLTSITAEAFDRVFAINARAPLLVAQEAAKRMRAGGRIINISSMTATRVFGGGLIAYGATKAALDYMTVAMAQTLGPRGITVNAVAPGATYTDFTRGLKESAAAVARLEAETALGAVGEPEDIADAVALVASPDSRWITGERIKASGGTQL